MSNFGAELLEKIPSVGYGYFLEVYIQYLLLTVNLPVSGHLQDKIPSFHLGEVSSYRRWEVQRFDYTLSNSPNYRYQ